MNNTSGAAEAAPAGKLRSSAQRKSGLPVASKSRPSLKALAFVATVALPSLTFGAYSMMASDRFASSASFVVRSQAGSQGGGGDVLESITGSVSSGSTKSDSYIIRNFVSSPDLVRLLDDEFDFVKLFARDGIDLGQRLSSDPTFEEKIRYWENRSWSAFDHTTGILTLEVQAFTPEEAEALASRMMEHIRDQVNALSGEARAATYELAKEELSSAEDYMRQTQLHLKEFRSRTGVADPAVSASRDDATIRDLNQEIITQKATLDQMEQTILRPGPNVESLRLRIASLEKQRDEMLLGVAAEQPGAQITADLMSEYETLVLETEIAKARYSRMLESLETARREAERQQRYLAIYSDPYVAEEAAYPRRYINPLICFVTLTLLWAIANFLIAMVRDHRK